MAFERDVKFFDIPGQEGQCSCPLAWLTRVMDNIDGVRIAKDLEAKSCVYDYGDLCDECPLMHQYILCS